MYSSTSGAFSWGALGIKRVKSLRTKTMEPARGGLSRSSSWGSPSFCHALPTPGAPQGPTCQRVDEAAGQQGQHGDQGPVGEALAAHAAVDGDGSFVTLEGRSVVSETQASLSDWECCPQAGSSPCVQH